MQKKIIPFPLCFVLFFFAAFTAQGQQVDTLKRNDSIPAAKVDSLIKAQHSPRKAAIRSAIIPGWGQAYNRKYWKIPIVYAALGTTGYIFVTNIQTYRDLKFSYAAKYKASLLAYDSSNPRPGPYKDSTDYFKIKPNYLPLSLESLREYRTNTGNTLITQCCFCVVLGIECGRRGCGCTPQSI